MLIAGRLLFVYFAAMILILAGLAVTRRNPVHSVLLVLAMFLHMAGVYLTLGAEFLAAVQMIVYAGAVLVLYLFVVFLVDLRQEARRARFVDWHSNGLLVALVFFLVLLAGVHRAPSLPVVAAASGGDGGGVQQLAVELFTSSLLPFEVTGIVLLVAVLGGMVLARRDGEGRGGEKEVER